MNGSMGVGVGLPAAVPGVDATTIGEWAGEAERAGFASLGVKAGVREARNAWIEAGRGGQPRIATGR